VTGREDHGVRRYGSLGYNPKLGKHREENSSRLVWEKKLKTLSEK
jgi:hypothetical protein